MKIGRPKNTWDREANFSKVFFFNLKRQFQEICDTFFLNSSSIETKIYLYVEVQGFEKIVLTSLTPFFNYTIGVRAVFLL